MFTAPHVIFATHLTDRFQGTPGWRNGRRYGLKIPKTAFNHRTLNNYGLDLRDLLKSLGEDPGKFEAQSLRRFVLEKSQSSGGAVAKRCTVSELIGLHLHDITLQPQASVLVHGKGRKERCLPLWKETAAALRAWLSVRGEVLVPELFLNARNESMTRSGFEYILRKHVHTAKERSPTLSARKVSPHVLRHTCAMTILQH